MSRIVIAIQCVYVRLMSVVELHSLNAALCVFVPGYFQVFPASLLMY
jgi:hypothetical protein